MKQKLNELKFKKHRYSKTMFAIFRTLCWLNNHFYINKDKQSYRANYLAFVFYPKWVHGECRHLCMFCEYKHECFSNLDEV